MGKQMFVLVIGLHIFIWSVISMQVLLTPETVLADKNSSVTLTCTYTGSGNVQLISWEQVIGNVGGDDDITKGKVLLPSCDIFSITPDVTKYSYNCSGNKTMTWTILNVTRTNDGEVWACELYAEGMSHYEYSNGVMIQLKVPITSVHMTFPDTNAPMHLVEYSEQLFTCITSGGRPAANVSWFIDSSTSDDPIDDIEITNDITRSQDIKNGHIYVSSDLKLNVTRSYNDGKIYCTAVNIEGQTPVVSSRKPLLQIKYAPEGPPVILGYNNGDVYMVPENTIGRLTCSTSGGNPLPSLTWLCYNNGTTSYTETTVTRTVTWTVEKGTERRCSCKSTQEVAGTETVYVDIQILYKAVITKFDVMGHEGQNAVPVMEHSDLTFVCKVESNPASYMKLKFNGKLLNEEINAQSLTYSLTDVQCSDHGTYSCTGENAYNDLTASRQDIDLLVKCPPSLFGTFATDISGSSFGTVVITVPIVTYPELNKTGITWQKWDNIIWRHVAYSHNTVFPSMLKVSTNGSTVTYVSLVIISLTPELSGKYRLTADNGIGSLKTEINVNIQEERMINAEAHDPCINIGGIVGAAIGGLAVGVIMTVLVVFFWKLRQKAAPSKHIEEIEINTRNESTYESVDQDAGTNVEHTYTSTGEINP